MLLPVTTTSSVLRSGVWLPHPPPFFYIHQLSLAFSCSSNSFTKDFQQRAAGAPYWLLSPDWGWGKDWGGGFHRKSMAAYFPPVLWFSVWTNTAPTIPIHSAELFPFRCASLQIAEISGGPVSNCLSHLVFNLLKSGL